MDTGCVKPRGVLGIDAWMTSLLRSVINLCSAQSKQLVFRLS